MTTRISINGTIHDDQATISVLDRGFLYGDSIYEVLRTYSGRAWALQEHLQRLQRSARLLAIPLPLSTEELEAEIAATIKAAENEESYVRLIVTRGAGPINLDPESAIAPCRVVIVTDLRPIPADLYETGVKVHLVSAGGRSAAVVSGGAKSGNYLPNILALAEAKRHGAYEALLLDSGGRIAEGSSSNVFALCSGKLRTPRGEEGILQGITRRFAIELASQIGHEVIEDNILPHELQHAEEVFLTSTLREVLPVAEINDHSVGDGTPGPVARALRDAYRRRIEDWIAR